MKGMVGTAVLSTTPSGTTAISVRNLNISVADGAHVIARQFSCDIERGETVALFGPSGQGKTSVALALDGLLGSGLVARWDALCIDGTSVEGAQDNALQGLRGARIGFVFQDPLAALNPVLPCGTQVEDPLRFHRLATAEQRRVRALALLRELGLDDAERIYRSFPSHLSGGQLQRVALARALITRPALLIADEPTTALDPDTRKDVLGLLAQIRKRHEMAILLITHDQETVRTLADRVVDINGLPVTLEPSEKMTDKQHPLDSRNQMGMPSAPEAEGHPHVLSVRALSKTFWPRSGALLGRSEPTMVIRNVHLDVGEGEVVGLVGESGAGKTTLIRCIAGLSEPDAGMVSIDGTPRRLGFGRMGNGEIQVIFQNPYLSLPPHFTVLKALRDSLRATGRAEWSLRTEAEGLLGAVGLEPGLLDRHPSQLSGGQCQRVALARCLGRRPRILLADEPTASLDEESKSTVARLLRETARSRGIGIVVASHDHKLLAGIADRVFLVAGGELRPFAWAAHAPDATETLGADIHG